MKPKKIKNYATGTVAANSVAGVEKFMDSIKKSSIGKANETNAAITYKDRNGLDIIPATITAGEATEAVEKPSTNYATKNDLEKLARFIAGQNNGGLQQVGADQNSNPGGGGSFIVNPDYNPNTPTKPTEAETAETKTPKIIAWAKANALYLGIAAAVIMYIIHKRKKS